MTTIAMQIREDGRVIASGDLRCMINGQMFVGPPKVWAAGRVCWGWAGSALLGRWCARNPPPADPDDLDGWADALRARAVETGQFEGGAFTGEALIGYAAPVASIYIVGCDGAVVRIGASHYAIGSGAPYAIGAMESSSTSSGAVRVAAMHDSGTGPGVVSVEARP